MREFIWVAGIVILAMLLFRGVRQPPLQEPPADAWFQSHVVAPSASRPVVVKFGATWCGPCKKMESQLDELAAALPGQVDVVRIDVDERRDLAKHFGVSGIPDTLVFKDGQAVARDRGYLDAAMLKSWVQPWIK
jgi:thioredoxin 1